MTAPKPSSNSFTLHLFGPLQAWVRGEPLTHLRSRKGYWLLALLALRANREVERQWLTGLLWPESPPELASRSLRTSLNDLRRALGSEATRLCSPTPRTLGLDLTGAAVDVLAFDDAVVRGTPEALAEAVVLYRGPLLEGCGETWAFEERQERELAFLAALEALADRALQTGDPATAERHLRRVVATDPLREGSQRALMEALASGGSYAAALQVYRDLRHRLYRELNTSPDPETQALFAAIQVEAERESGGSDSRMKPVAAPPRDAVSHNLPHSLTRFIGREREIADLTERLTGSDARLVTLTGVGGAGKSRLALEVSRQLVETTPDGVWLVELASLSDPTLVTQAVAGVLGVREEPGRPLLTALIGALRSRQLLLLLDNCEHLVEACAGLTEALLQACSHLRILATSRESLGIKGEGLFHVPPLSLPPVEGGVGTDAPARRRPAALSNSSVPGYVPAPIEPPAAIAGSDAVQLFLDRATQALPTFRLTGKNAAPVAAVCRRLDGLPLAIELAAARLRMLPVEEIELRLGDRFRLLTAHPRIALPRHQTLRAALDWSYDLLSPQEQTLLRRLSIFAGGFTVPAVEAVCVDAERDPGQTAAPAAQSGIRAEDVLDLLTELVDQSLVTVEDHGGVVRHRLLETVRLYSAERLSGKERSEVAFRHAAYYVALAEAEDPRQGARDQAAGLERLETEHDNLRAALQWSLEADGNKEWGLRLATALGWFWHLRYHLRQGLGWFEALLVASGGPERVPLALWARAQAAIGGLYGCSGRLPQQRRHLESSLQIARENGDHRQIAWSLLSLGVHFDGASEPDAALKHYEQALSLFRKLEDQLGICHGLAQFGWTEYYLHRDPERARTLLEESLKLAIEIGDLTVLPNCLQSLASLARDVGDLGKARAYHEQRLAVARSLGNQVGIAASLEHLGKITHEQEDHATAAELLREALRLYREMERPWGEATILGSLGDVSYCQGALAEALTLHQQALRMWRQLEFEGGMLRSLTLLTELAWQDGDRDSAHTYAHEAWTIWRNWEERWRADALRHAGQGWRRAVLFRTLDLASAAAGETGSVTDIGAGHTARVSQPDGERRKLPALTDHQGQGASA